MRTRARSALGVGWWWVIAVTSTLREVGATGAALAIYRHERRRCDRRMAAVRARRR